MVPDGNTLVTHILAGSSELTLTARISLDQAMQARDRWTNGRVEFDPTYWVTAYPQFVNPNPPIIANLQFRRALQYAADRQQMADAIAGGMAGIADSTVSPNQREYRDIESAIVRYPYDPRRATQLIEELGYARGPDGMFRDGAGAPLAVQNTATAQLDYQVKALSAVSDYWRRVGVTVEEIVIPNQRVGDRELRHARPGFETLGLGNDPDYFLNFHSSRTPLPQNNFVGTNRSRYMNAEFDALIDQYFQTIPWSQRMEVLRGIVHHATDQLPFNALFYATSSTLIGNRLKNVGGRGPNSTEAWNGEQWDTN
jgi:peptide/nickel transport system substrate-binding protein